MSVATQWMQGQRRALDANQRWKQEQRRLLEELLGDAGIMQLLPKFIEEEVGYETIILPNFGREEMKELGMGPCDISSFIIAREKMVGNRRFEDNESTQSAEATEEDDESTQSASEDSGVERAPGYKANLEWCTHGAQEAPTLKPCNREEMKPTARSDGSPTRRVTGPFPRWALPNRRPIERAPAKPAVWALRWDPE